MKNFLDETTINKKIDRVIFSNNTKSPIASVIIVAYNPDMKLFEENIKSLKTNNTNSYEILVIDNSDKPHIQNFITKYELNYIKLKRNYGLTAGRNVGINYSKGQILIFLDDDAIPESNYINEHIKAHQENDIVALRGKCLPRTKSLYNNFAHHYDLGDHILPYYVNLEGNSSFNKQILVDIGGFNLELKGAGGHEGLEISKRIVEKLARRDSIIYYPNAIIYHDYSKSLIHYLKKQLRHENHKKYILENHPDFLDFNYSYNYVNNRNHKSYDYITKNKMLFVENLSKAILKLQSTVNGN